MFDAVRFVEPAAFAWLLTLPVLWTAWGAHRWYRRRTRLASGIGIRRRRLSSISGGVRDAGVLAGLTVAAVLLVAAAARPQALVRQPQYETFDLIVLLDRSASMLATDVTPSRIGRACIEVENFLVRKPASIDRVALVAFAGTPIVTSHLTNDLEILSFFLDWMKKDHTPFYGTDVAATLERAVTLAAEEEPERRKVVVLLSDGEDHSELLRTALGKIRNTGMPVYTIGIGGDAPVSIPAPRGSDTPTLRDDDDRVLQARFSEATLRQIATGTNGRYYRSQSGTELSGILAAVVGREGRPTRFIDTYCDLDVPVLGAAAAAVAGLLILL
jgi:Ca-activated chloride channel family protein